MDYYKTNKETKEKISVIENKSLITEPQREKEYNIYAIMIHIIMYIIYVIAQNISTEKCVCPLLGIL